MAIDPSDIAVWVITPNGYRLSEQLRVKWPKVAVRISRRLATYDDTRQPDAFTTLSEAVQEDFQRFKGHIFIMATGIVVRVIAPLLRHKTVDPAVVVVDDLGRFAISLTAGHIGGANELSRQVADLVGAVPVITTATDINNRPAVDMLASQLGLKIENPPAIKTVNMALLRNEKLVIHDPMRALGGLLAEDTVHPPQHPIGKWDGPGVYVDDREDKLPDTIVVLRPATLCVGIGCNRNTPAEEIGALVHTVFNTHGLALQSIYTLASIDLKADEAGLLALADDYGVPLTFFSSETLNQVRHVPNPSVMAAKHVGANSVCEAAAVLAAHPGPLIVPKHKTRNVTVAVARRPFTSSASAPEV